MKNNYAVVVKTGEAEIRSLNNFHNRESILPIIELTRGRKSKLHPKGNVEKRLQFISDCFKNQTFILDLTSDENLLNEEIKNLYDYSDGYKNWIEFLSSNKTKYEFSFICPTILINSQDDQIEINLNIQIKKIGDLFGKIAYRCSFDSSPEDYQSDIDLLYNSAISNIYFIIDCSLFSSCDLNNISTAASDIINYIQEKRFEEKDVVVSIIVVATSFPESSSIPHGISSVPILEIQLFETIKHTHSDLDLIYGDYASVSPKRNDMIVMARGWVPRIDLPLESEIKCIKKRKEKSEYSATYSIVAKNIMQLPEYETIQKLSENWGISQIKTSAIGLSPGSTPSFWISVRMNIHMDQQIKRLESK